MPKATSSRYEGHSLPYSQNTKAVIRDQPTEGQEVPDPFNVPSSSKASVDLPKGSDKTGAERIPQPPNCFFIFRSEMRNLHTELCERKRSKFASGLWNKMTEKEKEPWREKARVAKRNHLLKYPNYKRTRGPDKKKRDKKDEETAEGSNDTNSTNISVPPSGDQHQNNGNQFIPMQTYGYANFPLIPMYIPTQSSWMYQQGSSQHGLYDPLSISAFYPNANIDPFSTFPGDGTFIAGPLDTVPTTLPQPFPNQYTGNFENPANFTLNQNMPWPVTPIEENNSPWFPIPPP